MNVHNSITYNNPKVETTQVSANLWMDNRMRNIHTMEYYSVIKRNKVMTHVTTWVNLANLLSARSQACKATYFMIQFIRNVHNRQIHRKKKENCGVRGGKYVVENREWLLLSMEYLLEMMKMFWMSGDGYRTLWTY